MRSINRRLLENELLSRLIKNAGYLFSGTSLSAALAMLQGILVARLLGVDGYGVLGTMINFTNLINKFASFRMHELVVKYVSHFTEQNDLPRAAATFKLAALMEMCASIIAFGLIWLLSPLGAQYFAKDASLAPVFTLYGSVVLVNLIAESSTGLLQTFDKFRSVASFTIIQSLVSLAVTVVVFLMGGDIQSVALAYVSGKAIGACGLTLRALGIATEHWGTDWWRSPLTLFGKQLRELLKFAFSTNLSATINLINKDSEVLWVSFFRSPLEAGYYKLAMTLANIVELPVTPLPQAIYPELSRQSSLKNWSAIQNLLRQGSLLAGGYSLVAATFLVLAGQPLIAFLYKPEFLPAYPALMILLAGYLVSNTFFWRRVILLALGRPDFPVKLNLTLAVGKVAGVLLFVPRLGYLASAALLAGFYWLGSAISVWKSRQLISSASQQREQLA